MRIIRKPHGWCWGLGMLFVFFATQNCQCQVGNSFKSSGSPDAPTTTSLLRVKTTPEVTTNLLEGISGSEALSVKARAAHRQLLADVRQRTFLKIDFEGGEMKVEDRPPLNVALVLDRSGSMAGTKLDQAKEAALMVLQKLRTVDRVSLVTYDNAVQVISAPMHASRWETLIDPVKQIQSGGSTNIHGGVCSGADMLEIYRNPSYVNRIVLLSDGKANVGPQSPQDMASLGRALGRKGIGVTTIGLGTDYDPKTLTGLAEQSEGNHFFARHAEDLREAFELEFTRGVAVAATDVNIRVRLHPQVRLRRVLNAQARHQEGQEIEVYRRQLYGNHKAFLLLEVDLPPMEDGAELNLAQVRVDFVNPSSGERESVGAVAQVDFSDDRKDVAESEQAEVMVAVAGVLGNRRAQDARRLYEAGRVNEAKREFKAVSKYLDQNGRHYRSKKLRDLARLNEEMITNTAEAMPNHYQHENLKTFGSSNMGANPY